MTPTLAQAISHHLDSSSLFSVSVHAGGGRQATLSILPEISDLVSCLTSSDTVMKSGQQVDTISGVFLFRCML
jgi:hypothetical protein